MRVSIVFVRVVTKPEYDTGTLRWLLSYERYKPTYPHEVVVINRYADNPDTLFDSVQARHLRYDGGGWDCGAWQFAGRELADRDLLVCFNSSTYITGHGWLDRFVGAVEAHGDGLYGPLTSNEIVPHVRTPCMVFQPKIVMDYPEEVNSRDDTYRFESMGYPSGVPNFTQWTRSRGWQTRLVTWDGCYDMTEWRNPPNIFRRGDQSNLMVRDRHCEAYEVSDEAGKRTLEGLADG